MAARKSKAWRSKTRESKRSLTEVINSIQTPTEISGVQSHNYYYIQNDAPSESVAIDDLNIKINYRFVNGAFFN